MKASEAVEVLNSLHEADAKAMDGFMQLCTPVNRELAEHPTAIVSVKNSGDNWHSPVLRPLGFLNAFVEGEERAAAQYDEEQHLIGFCVVSPEDFETQNEEEAS